MKCPGSLKLFVVGLLLAGCQGEPKPAATPVSSSTPLSSPTPTVATATPSPQAKATPRPQVRGKGLDVKARTRKSDPTVEGDGGQFQGKKQSLRESARRGAPAKADSRIVAAVLGKTHAISETIHSRTFEVAIQWLLESGRYDDLERLGDYYRDSRERMLTGQRKSTIFYYALKAPRVPNGGKWLPYQLMKWKDARPNSPHPLTALARVCADADEGRWNGEFEKLEGELNAAFAQPREASRRYLEEAARLSPNSDVYALLIDQVRREGGSVEDAEVYLKKSDQADSDNYHAEAQYAKLLSQRGRNWREAFSSPVNAYFGVTAYLTKVSLPPKESLDYALAAEKAFPKSALVKSEVANAAMKAREFDVAAKRFSELGDRVEIYGWDNVDDFHTARNRLESQGYKVRSGKFFPLPETPVELRQIEWQDDLLIRQASELYETQQFLELEAVAQAFRAKTARLADGRRKVSRIYAAIEDEYWTKGRTSWQRSVFAERWRKLAPKSVMAATLAGRAAISEAWDIRGGGYADSVSESAWEGFRERLEVAEGYLSEARASQGAKDPELYQHSITLAMGAGLDKKVALSFLEQAKAVDKFAPEPYSAMVTYLLPRWHGSQEELAAFLDNVPPEVFVEAAMSAKEDVDLTSPGVRRGMLDGVVARAERHPSTETWSLVLLVASGSNDRKVGARAIASLGGRWSPNVIADPTQFKRLVAWSQGAALK